MKRILLVALISAFAAGSAMAADSCANPRKRRQDAERCRQDQFDQSLLRKRLPMRSFPARQRPATSTNASKTRAENEKHCEGCRLGRRADLFDRGVFCGARTGAAENVKVCEDEWKAHKADNQAKGITEKAYVEKCRAASAEKPKAAPSAASSDKAAEKR